MKENLEALETLREDLRRQLGGQRYCLKTHQQF
jgi:hypothetical protein